MILTTSKEESTYVYHLKFVSLSDLQAVGVAGGVIEGAVCYTTDKFQLGRYTEDYFMNVVQHLVQSGVHIVAIKVRLFQHINLTKFISLRTWQVFSLPQLSLDSSNPSELSIPQSHYTSTLMTLLGRELQLFAQRVINGE